MKVSPNDNDLTDDFCVTDSDCRDCNATWIDGTEKWYRNEPNNCCSGEDCGKTIDNSGSWNDLNCVTNLLYKIIEFDQ